jgi:hypothetical protein
VTAGIVLTCDHPMEGGTCAAHIAVATVDLDHAIRAGQRAGWSVTLGGGALCPQHNRGPRWRFR